MARKSQNFRYIYRITLLLLFIFKFTGLATFTVKKQEISKGKWLEYALDFTGGKIGILYNLFLSCLVVAINYVTVPILYIQDYANKTRLTMLIEVFQTTIGCVMIFSTSLYYCANQSALVRIANYLVETRASLRRLQKPLDDRRIFRIFSITYLLNLCLFTSVWITEYFAFHITPIIWLTDIMPTGFVSLLYMQYFSVITWIDAVFSKINFMIEDFSKFDYNQIRVSVTQPTRRVYSPLTIQVLVQIRNLHEQLCLISDKVSQFYATPVLVGISFTFITLLYNTYYLIDPFVNNTAITNPIICVNTIFWILAILYPLVLLTNKVTSIAKQMETTGGAVHTLLNRTFDREMKTELERFSLQLLHRKITFTVNGYFDLDNVFLHSIISTVTMYMIVLIQFEVGSPKLEIPPCNCTQT